MRGTVVLPLGLLVSSQMLLACAESKPKQEIDAGTVKVIGVQPDKFDCKSFLPEASRVAGGDVNWVPADFAPQHGTTPPCGFQRQGDESKSWAFSFDCRPVAESELDLLIKTRSADPDTKIVEIGRKAVDHSRAQLVFMDDDTPCAVWIVGPDEATRAQLAQLVLSKLNRENAPMHPRGQARTK
jgi:hypothetical protein